MIASVITRFHRLEPVQKLGLILLVVAVLITVAGSVNQYGGLAFIQFIEHLFRDFYSNLSTELFSIAITVLIIDAMVRRREREINIRREKEHLIRQMCDRDDTLALRSVDELRANGWLEDGSLEGVKLTRANLVEAHLEKADLRGAHLWFADLSRAWLCYADLHNGFLQAANLQQTVLDGTNLAGVNLNEANLLYAHIDKDTVFDRESILPDCTYWVPGTDMDRFTDPVHPDFWRSRNPRSPAYHSSSED